MSDRLDLQALLLEIQEDEAVDSRKATHLSQEQIRELVTRRNVQDTEPDPEPTEAA